MSDDSGPDKVAIARGLRFHEAQTLQRELESHDIESWVLDTSHTEQVAGTGLAPMGRLLVRPADEAKALEIITEFEKRPVADSSPDDAKWRAGLEHDATAGRAFRAAILGLACVPYLPQLYSFGLLMTLRPHYPELTGKTRKKMWAAGVVDGAVFLAASAVAWWAGYKVISALLVAVPVLVWWFGTSMTAVKRAAPR